MEHPPIVQAALAELASMEPKRSALLNLLATYGVSAPVSGAAESARLTPSVALAQSPSSRGRTPRPSKNAAIITEARAFIMARGNAPVPLKDIYTHLVDRGFEIGGQKPTATLSAVLSNSPEFDNSSRMGWQCVTHEPQEAEAPPADIGGGADVGEGEGVAAPEPSLGFNTNWGQGA